MQASLVMYVGVGSFELLDLADDFTDSYNDTEALARVTKNVSKVQKITKFIKNLTKRKELLERIQGLEECDQILRVALGVQTRWNSTFKCVEKGVGSQGSNYKVPQILQISNR
mgnify:CR=1 FL=1